MKAGIKNNHLKPLPIAPLVGAAAISGGSSLLGSVAGAITSSVQGEKQREHDKEMAVLNQKYVLEQMARQNRYQVDQWNRENEYNDPSAVRSRYEAAGISPHAAMGSGAANGAGIAGGLSSAPSGSSTGHSSTLPSAANAVANSLAHAGTDVGNIILRAQEIESNVANTNADTDGKLIDNLTKAEQNLLNLENARADIVKKLSESNLNDARRKTENKRIEQLDQQIAESRDRIGLIKAQISESKERTKNLSASTDKTTAETDRIKVETDQLRYNAAVIHEGIKSNNALNYAQARQAMESADKIAEDIKLVEKDLENYDIKLVAQFAKMTSEELRGWTDVVNEYLRVKSNSENADRFNKLQFIRIILPFLLKNAK